MKFIFLTFIIFTFAAQAADTYECNLNYSAFKGMGVPKNNKAQFEFNTELVNPNGRNEKIITVTFPQTKLVAKINIVDMEHSCVDPEDCNDIPASWKDWFTLSVNFKSKQEIGGFTTTFMKGQLAIYGGWSSDSSVVSQTAVLNCEKK